MKGYTNTLKTHVSDAKIQSDGHLCRFVYISEADKLELANEITKTDSEEDKILKVRRQPKRATRVRSVSCVNSSLFLYKASGLPST